MTLPSFSIQAALKFTEANLDLISDPTLFLFFEKQKRGGISVVSARYAESNMNHRAEEFRPEKPREHLSYYDANNLYGYVSRFT